jgi:hypothetical protein
MELHDFMMQFPKKNIVNILFTALKEMKENNEQSIDECLLKSIGDEGENKEEIKEKTFSDYCPDCGKQLINGYGGSGVRCPDEEGCGYWFCF